MKVSRSSSAPLTSCHAAEGRSLDSEMMLGANFTRQRNRAMAYRLTVQSPNRTRSLGKSQTSLSFRFESKVTVTVDTEDVSPETSGQLMLHLRSLQ